MMDMNYALMLIKAKKLNGAKDILEELLKSNLQDKDILYNLGMCYTELDEPERAAVTFFSPFNAPGIADQKSAGGFSAFMGIHHGTIIFPSLF